MDSLFFFDSSLFVSKFFSFVISQILFISQKYNIFSSNANKHNWMIRMNEIIKYA